MNINKKIKERSNNTLNDDENLCNQLTEASTEILTNFSEEIINQSDDLHCFDPESIIDVTSNILNIISISCAGGNFFVSRYIRKSKEYNETLTRIQQEMDRIGYTINENTINDICNRIVEKFTGIFNTHNSK